MIDGLYIVDGLCALLMEHRKKLPHHARDDHSVVRCAVVVELGQAEVIGDDIELEALELRQQRLRQRERIEEHRGELQPLPVRRGGHKADVKMRVVRDDGTVADEVDEHLHGFFFLGRARNVAVADAGELGDVRRDVALRVDEGVEHLLYLRAGENDGADLGHAVVHCVEAGRLYIESDKLRIERELALADDGAVAVHVVYKIALLAVDDLDAVLLAGLPHIRESLRDAVVGDGDGGHAPIGRARDDRIRIGERVEGRKARVHMQLDAFFLGIVGADITLAFHDIARVEHHIVIIFGIDYLALDDDMVAFFDLVDNALVVFGAEKARDAHGIRAVGDIKAKHGAAALCKSAARDIHNVALDGDFAGFERQRVHRDGALLYRPAHEHIARRLCAALRSIRGDGGAGGAHSARIVRHDADGAQAVIVPDAAAYRGDVHRGGHGRKPGADAQGHFA